MKLNLNNSLDEFYLFIKLVFKISNLIIKKFISKWLNIL